MNPWACLLGFMWLCACTLIIVLFGLDGLIVMGVVTFCGIFGAVASMAANY
jgi:hypothetical protein